MNTTIQSSTPLLLSYDSIAGLRSRLTGSSQAEQWRRLITLSRSEPRLFSAYTVLTALLTGEAEDRARARAAAFDWVERREEIQLSVEAQVHSHVISAPLGRWAIYVDWMLEGGLLTAEEGTPLLAALLDHAQVIPLQHLQSRRCDFDNQMLANAFSAAAVGYVAGIRRGDSALGRRIMEVGLGWLRGLFGCLPPGGWTGEGSTYQEHVVMPLVAWSGLLMQHITGEPVMEQGVAPARVPLTDVLRLGLHLIGPGGLLPAWDAYGFQTASVKAPLVWLARHTSDGEALAVIADQQMWARTTLPAWELDDRVWSLLWWPEDLAIPDAPRYAPWIDHQAGGAVQDAATRTRLFQCWDLCGGLTNAGRAQMDPNAITLEAFGSPVLLDGAGSPPSPVHAGNEPQILAFLGEERLASIAQYHRMCGWEPPPRSATIAAAVAGSVGQSNALILDGEDWYVPQQAIAGTGVALHQVGPLQVLTGDATAMYTSRYDVHTARRTSVLLDGRHCLISDVVGTTTPHSLTWQAFVRPAAHATGSSILIQTPEGVGAVVVPLQAGTLDLTSMPNYPERPMSGGSVRLRHSVPPAADHRLDVAILVEDLLEPVSDLSDDWSVAGESGRHRIDAAPSCQPGSTVVWSRSFACGAIVPGNRHIVRIARPIRGLTVQLNGVELQPTSTSSGVWSDSSSYLPACYEATGALRSGVNELRLVSPVRRGEAAGGPVLLVRLRTPSPAGIRRAGCDGFIITSTAGDDHLIVGRTALATWADGTTDARHAVLRADRTLAACAVTSINLPDYTFRSRAPLDLHHHAEGLMITATGRTWACSAAWSGGDLQIECGGTLAITYRGNRPLRLELSLDGPVHLAINGKLRGMATPDQRNTWTITLEPTQTLPNARPETAEAVYACAAAFGVAAWPALRVALDAADWRVRLAAVDALGRLALPQAADPLLALLAETARELPYPPLRYWLKDSKMLRDPLAPEGLDPELPLPASLNRWRLRRAVVTALGLIGDPRAVDPIEAILTDRSDHFTIASQASVALGRLGQPRSLAILLANHDHNEINLQFHTRLAINLLRGEIDRATFEARVNPQ